MTVLPGVKGSWVLLATAILLEGSPQSLEMCGVSQWPYLSNFMKSTMIPFPTDVATTTQGHQLQLARDLKLTNTILETSKDSFVKPPPFRREEVMDANSHLNQDSLESRDIGRRQGHQGCCGFKDKTNCLMSQHLQ